jgi:NAD(P)H-nitrite reductase large subunit
VYAAGDVAQPPHFHHKRNELITLWPEAVFQARIAAENALGGESTYSGGLRMNSVVFYDIPYIFYGDIQEDELEDCTVYTRTADSGRIYRKIVLKDGILVGAVIAGDVRFAGVVYWAIKSRRPIPDPERYLSVSGLYSLYEEFGERDIVNLPNIK